MIQVVETVTQAADNEPLYSLKNSQLTDIVVSIHQKQEMFHPKERHCLLQNDRLSIDRMNTKNSVVL